MTKVRKTPHESNPELRRLADDADRKANWKRWGPYLSERQWGTVREDYSADGSCWSYFPHDQAPSRTYRWGEDGLLGFCDRQCRLCFALALWNGRDPILKERLFGLGNNEANHGEDVKECYYYLDSTPTHSYCKALYKYPQTEFPYQWLRDENRRRSQHEGEFELLDTGIFKDGRYFDVQVEYAKAVPDDILIKLSVANRGPDAATLHLLPTLWFRNTWSWGKIYESTREKPSLSRKSATEILARHESLDDHVLAIDPDDARGAAILFTENETNIQRLFNAPNKSPFVKDAFHEAVIHARGEAVNPKNTGTKAAWRLALKLQPGEQRTIRLRLSLASSRPKESFGPAFDRAFNQRKSEADAYYNHCFANITDPAQREVARQSSAGLLWSKQFYNYVVEEWLEGDPDQPPPPPQRTGGRNADWTHLFNRDVISMPDKWEYPWYAAWDLAFHMIPMAKLDPTFAKEQLTLFLREWYMHPNGQIPAYEFNLSDVNPPVHAWACWRVYKLTAPRGQRDTQFLASCFQKLLFNFTWWVNRKDLHGNHLFSGGFLGLDNIGVFDRSRPLPGGGHLVQADGTAWMAFYCITMLSMALELAKEQARRHPNQTGNEYEDLASKFFEHFIHIAIAMNTLGGSGLWDEDDGFYYDKLQVDGQTLPLRIRSMVGLIPLFAVVVLDDEVLDVLPGFTKRLRWFLNYRKDMFESLTYLQHAPGKSNRFKAEGKRHLLAIPSRTRLQRVLQYMLDENEFLSPYGIRSLSRHHLAHPYELNIAGEHYSVPYIPGESTNSMFGGNSNWRGPVWFPVNFLLVEALERWHYYYGEELKVECPTGSGRMMNLKQVAAEINRRLTQLFLPDSSSGGRGGRPCHGGCPLHECDPHWKNLVLFHEYFHGDTGRGIGANHQTGWTALVASCLESVANQQRSDSDSRTRRAK